MSILQIHHEQYLRHPSYGASDIIKMSRSFAYYKWRKANPEKPGRPMIIGSATHLLLQAEITGDAALKEGILTYGDGSSLTNGFKKFQGDNPLKYCLDDTEARLVGRMVRAILDEPAAMEYLKGAIAEPTIMGAYPNTTVPCKCRPDYLHIDKGVSINIKTTTDASESGFIYSTKDWQYDFQSAFYCDLLSQEFGKPFDEVHILVEKAEDGEPIPVEIFSFSDDTISCARSQIHTIMEKLPECEKSGIWPKPRAFLKEVDVPLYARKIVSL